MNTADYTQDQIRYAVNQMIELHGEDSIELNQFLDYLNMGEKERTKLSETVRDIVPIEQFITDPYYMGSLMASVWPNTIKSVAEVCTGGYFEAVFTGAIGAAKCLSLDTPVIMYDGTVKMVQDVQVGDLLLGPDSEPRKVESLARGREEMFNIKQKGGDDYTVNRSHILSLKSTNTTKIGFHKDALHNISVDDYLKLPRYKQQYLKGWKPDVTHFPESGKELTIPPYILGVWLGDGHSDGTRITTMDEQVDSAWRSFAESRGLYVRKSLQYRKDGSLNKSWLLSLGGQHHETGKRIPNTVTSDMRDLNLISNKHIPQRYLTASVEDRYELLAGLLDTDGSLHKRTKGTYTITQVKSHLTDSVALLGRSLGLRVSVKVVYVKGAPYYKATISGDLDKIPCRVPHKQATPRKQKKNVNRWGIEVESVGEGDYYGFTLSGNDRLFMLGDFTVTHNTTRATIVCAYNLYVLSCYRHPQEKLGLMANSDIVFAMLNKTAALASKVTYKRFRKLIESIPYFDIDFPYDKRIESELKFPNNIMVLASNADNDKLLGMDVVGGCFPPSQKFISSNGELLTMGEQIGVNQSVMTTDDMLNVVGSDDTKVIHTGEKTLLRLIFGNDEEIICTPDQRFRDEENNWVRAEDAYSEYFRFSKVSDIVSNEYKIEYSECIEVINLGDQLTPVYDVENTGSTHTFFAPTDGGKLALHAKNCIDEINFFEIVEKSKKSRDGGQFDQALEIYNGLTRRIKSRFQGVPPEVRGCMCVVSSRSHKGDFTDMRMKEVAEETADGSKATTYISNESQWSFMPHLRPDGTVRFGPKRFMVALGNERMRSEIIGHRRAAEGREIIQVPMELFDDFDKDMDGSLRDFAGRVSDNTGGYFGNPQVIWNSADSFDNGLWHRIFTEEVWDLDKGMPPLNRQWRPFNPRVPRFVHLDLSITGDLCGFAMGHSVTDAPVTSRFDTTKFQNEKAPKIIYDEMLAIEAPKGGRISFAAVRQLLYYLRDFLRIPIEYVSMDSFQSEDMKQILGKKGFECLVISVEGEDAYKSLKNAFEEDRIQLPVHHHAFNELINLVHNKELRRIDHKSGSSRDGRNSKDVSDCLAGINQNMMAKYEAGDLYKRSMLMNLYGHNQGGLPLVPRNR